MLDEITIRLNLSEFRVTKVVEHQDRYIISVVRHLDYGVCPECNTLSEKINDRSYQPIRDLPILTKKVFLLIDKRRFKCDNPDCKRKTFTERLESVKARFKRTKRYDWYLYNRGRKTPFASVYTEEGIHPLTFFRVWHREAEEYLKAIKHPKPYRYLGMDEFATKKGQNYNTVITDVVDRVVLDVIEGRKAENAKAYLEAVPSDQFPIGMVIDMWDPYKKAIKDTSPQTMIVIDKFHVIRKVNEALDKIRIRLQGETIPKGLIFHCRKLLVTARENLKEEKEQKLDQLLSQIPELKRAYWFKESLRDWYNTRTHIAATSSLTFLIDYAKDLDIPEITEVSKSLNNWFKEITNYFILRLTNGFTEGINNKIKTDKRNAYGYRNFQNQRRKILTFTNHYDYISQEIIRNYKTAVSR